MSRKPSLIGTLKNILFRKKLRDVSNNLKLYRADILKNMEITQPHFAANAETGLKPILAGYDILEVPISWINRTVDLGSSSFSVTKVGSTYFSVLFCLLVTHNHGLASAN